MEDHLTQLKSYLTTFPNGKVKDHVLHAIQELDLQQQLQQYSYFQPEDRLVLLVHFLFLEKCKNQPPSDRVPLHWNQNAEQRVYEFHYTHDHISQDELVIKLLFLGEVLQLHAALNSKPSQIFSLQLPLTEYFDAANCTCLQIPKLRDLLQQNIFTPLFPAPTPTATPTSHPPSQSQAPPPSTIPNVGRGDAVPSFLGGPVHPGSEVGPDHPIFQGPPIPQGPIPGARFDPFGPIPAGPGRPTPFQNPDHLRFPPDSNDPPFGSGNMFF